MPLGNYQRFLIESDRSMGDLQAGGYDGRLLTHVGYFKLIVWDAFASC